ncbi:hypothetical protein ACHAQA_001648 [Verticillium albo-atrum]
MTLPNTTEALVVQNGKLSKENIALPTPAENQVLVKVSHVAQNPTDVQSLDSNAFGDGAVLGCDFVGTVVQTGSKVTRVAEGATIAGLIWGGEIKGLGSYARYTLADERICFPVPEGTSPERAATVPLAVATALLALYSKESLAIDRAAGSETAVLVWGGSSSVGQYAIQLAAHQGLTVLTTASPRHHAHLRSLGAAHTFDYRDEHVASQIRSAAPGLRYVFDTIGNESSSATASQALDPAGGGVLCTVRPGKANTEGVAAGTRVTDVLVWTAFLKEHRYGTFVWPANEGDHALATELFEKLPGLLKEGTLKTSTPKVLEGGLDAVGEGFQEHRDGKISNYKIVYSL